MLNVVLSVFFWIVTASCTILIFIELLFLRTFLFPFDRQARFAHSQGFWWSDAIIKANPFWSFTLMGLERIDPHKTYVIVANHQSFADIVILYKTHMQFKWVAKESLFRIPIFGWCMSMMKYISLSRVELTSIKKTYQEAASWLRQGTSVLFFPEGTRSQTNQINDFKNGAFKLAIKEKKPILPVRIEGAFDIIPRGKWVFKARSRCRLTILPEIDTSNYAPQDFAILRDKTREILATASL